MLKILLGRALQATASNTVAIRLIIANTKGEMLKTTRHKSGTTSSEATVTSSEDAKLKWSDVIRVSTIIDIMLLTVIETSN